MQSNQEEQVTYTSFQDLAKPQFNQQQLLNRIYNGLSLPESQWKQLFESLTLLRILSKYDSQLYINQVFPRVIKNVVGIAEGLRSKLSKEALTLLYQTVKYNQLQTIDQSTLNILVESLFKMSNSEKKFIKQEALKSIIELQNAQNNNISYQLSAVTLNHNPAISELAITTLKKRLESQMVNFQEPNFKSFLKIVITNLNAGRAVLERTAKQILILIRNSYGENVFRQNIMSGLTEDQLKLVNVAIAEKQVKAKGNFKDFMKNKKQNE